MAPIRVTKVLYEEIDSTNFRRARRATGLAAKTLSLKAGLHEQFVSRLERGLIQEVSTDQLDALVEAMAGVGDFAGKDEDAVRDVIRGRAGFELRLVETASEAAYKAWCNQSATDLPERASGSVLQVNTWSEAA